MEDTHRDLIVKVGSIAGGVLDVTDATTDTLRDALRDILAAVVMMAPLIKLDPMPEYIARSATNPGRPAANPGGE